MKIKRLILCIDGLLLGGILGVLLMKDFLHEPVFPVMQTEDVRQMDVNKKTVALTFDDGPNAEYTETLLDELRKRDVQATFFLLGKEAEKEPELVRQMKEDGHNIGNHSYEHVNLQNLSNEAAIEQVTKTNEVIYEITGEYPIFIRPPFGSWKSNLDYETDMIEVLWDVDPLDWNTHNAEAVAERVIDKVQDNDIILLHDASESSVEAAVKIVDELQKQGYEFVTVEELLFE